VAIAGLVLIIWGYGLARQMPTVVYVPPTGLRHVALLLMLPVFPLLLAAYMPGRIQAVTRHPMLLATKIWALAHLLANGMLHDLLLFGGFLAWAIADRVSMKRREQRPVPGAPPSRYNDVIAVVAGLGIYVWFVLMGHAWLFGVSPAGNYAVVRFSGLVSDTKLASKTAELTAWLDSKGITPIGQPELARYNPPWTLPFLRRNEVIMTY
jgi:uncharacterized membrane protein